MSIVKLENLIKIYPGGTKALSDISFEMNDPGIIAILGPSGAGKSTLIRSINRLVIPTSGKIFFKDKEITSLHGKKLLEIRKNIGMIFQQFNLVERLDVLTNVLVGGLYAQTPLGKIQSVLIHTFSRKEKVKAYECLDKLGIKELGKQRVDTLSGGQKQRVAIARTLMQNPSIILADEPVASLDPLNTTIVLDHLKQIHDLDKIPIIINLHQADLAKKYASRIIGMNHGKIVFDDRVSELDSNQLSNIYSGEHL